MAASREMTLLPHAASYGEVILVVTNQARQAGGAQELKINDQP